MSTVGKKISGKTSDINLPLEMKESELLELVSARVKETLEETKHIRQQLDKTLSTLQGGVIKKTVS